MPVAHKATESVATSLPLLKDSGLCIQGCVLGFQKLISRCHIWAACLGSSLCSVLMWKECPAPPFGAKLCHTPGWLVALYLTWPPPEGPASIVLTQSPVCPHWHSAPGLPLWDAQPQPGLPILVWMIHVQKGHGLACSLAVGDVFEFDHSGDGAPDALCSCLRHLGPTSVCSGSISSRLEAFVST